MNDSMENLKRMLCKEIEEIAKKNDLSASDLDLVHKLVITKEKLLRIEELEEDLGYSEAGDWRAEGTYGRGGSYARGNSYRDPYTRRASMGRYSRAAESTKAK